MVGKIGKNGTIIIVVVTIVVIGTGTGIGLWLGLRDTAHPNPEWSFRVSGNLVGDTDYNISLSELFAMPSHTDTYFINRKPTENYTLEYTGVSLSYLIQNVIDINSSAENITIAAFDGYSRTFSISEFENNETHILAYASEGEYLTSYLDGGKGYLYLITPQRNPDDFNAQRCIKSVTHIIFE